MKLFRGKSREWLVAAIDEVEEAIAATTSEQSNPVVGALKNLSLDDLMRRWKLLDRALADKDGRPQEISGPRFLRGYGRI